MLRKPGTGIKNLQFGRVLEVLDSGSHNPLLCELVDGESMTEWVVKPASTSERGKVSILAELGGSEVCTWMQIPTPEIGLVRFPADKQEAEELISAFATLKNPSKERIEAVQSAFHLNLGQLAFCARYLKGAVDLTVTQFEQCIGQGDTCRVGSSLFLADIWMAHMDRTAARPNSLWYDGQVVAIDHGDAFIGLQKANSSGEELARKTVLDAFVKQHVLFSALDELREEEDWMASEQLLGAITREAILGVVRSWPGDLDEEKSWSLKELRAKFQAFLATRRDQHKTLVANAKTL